MTGWILSCVSGSRYSFLRRGRGSWKAEVQAFRKRWAIIAVGLIFQYVHGIFTQLAYRMHTPAKYPLHDMGFELLPELQAQHRWISEAIFTAMAVAFVAWSLSSLLHPHPSKRFSTVLLWSRVLAVLVVCQLLRIASFTATQLPGPALHCRAGTLTATRPWPHHWQEHLVVDVSVQLAHSCGDLMFSSHMTFILTGILTYTHLGRKPWIKALLWPLGLVLAALIIAARKHYTVDVVVACYTVPMVYLLLDNYWFQGDEALREELLTRSGCCWEECAAGDEECQAELQPQDQDQQQGKRELWGALPGTQLCKEGYEGYEGRDRLQQAAACVELQGMQHDCLLVVTVQP